MSLQEKIDNKIKSKKVMVFSKSYCPYCKMAKDVLNNMGLTDAEYEVWEIENDPKCAEIQKLLKKMTGESSVPRVFIKGKCIGGGTETKNMGAKKIRELMA